MSPEKESKSLSRETSSRASTNHVFFFATQSDKKKAPASVDEIIAKATNRAFKGGFAGSMAAALQVTSLMWVRTTMNYQYRYGTGTFEAIRVGNFRFESYTYTYTYTHVLNRPSTHKVERVCLVS